MAAAARSNKGRGCGKCIDDALLTFENAELQAATHCKAVQSANQLDGADIIFYLVSTFQYCMLHDLRLSCQQIVFANAPANAGGTHGIGDSTDAAIWGPCHVLHVRAAAQ